MGMWWVWIQHSGHREGRRISASNESEAARLFVNGAYTDELFPEDNDGDTCAICVAPFTDGIAERKEKPPHEKFGYRLKIRYAIERC